MYGRSLALAVQCETTHGVYEFRRGFCTLVLSFIIAAKLTLSVLVSPAYTLPFVQVNNSTSSKIAQITDTITKAIKALCQCQDTVIQEPFNIVCDIGGDKTVVIYYGRVSDESILDYITKWVENTDDITVSKTKLIVNKDCPVQITEMDSARCKPPTSGQQSGSDSVAAVAAPVVVILVLVGVGVLALVVVFLLWRKRTGKSYNFFR